MYVQSCMFTIIYTPWKPFMQYLHLCCHTYIYMYCTYMYMLLYMLLYPIVSNSQHLNTIYSYVYNIIHDLIYVFYIVFYIRYCNYVHLAERFKRLCIQYIDSWTCALPRKCVTITHSQTLTVYARAGPEIVGLA